MKKFALIDLLRRYLALLHHASRFEAEAHSLRLCSLEPQVAVLRSKLHLPAATQELPEFYRRLERDRGFVALALSLHIIVQLRISWEAFEATGRSLNTTDPDSIFEALLNRLPDSPPANN